MPLKDFETDDEWGLDVENYCPNCKAWLQLYYNIFIKATNEEYNQCSVCGTRLEVYNANQTDNP